MAAEKQKVKIRKQELTKVDFGIKKDDKPVFFDIKIETESDDINFDKFEDNQESSDTVKVK